MTQFGFDLDYLDGGGGDNPYTGKVDIPHYEIKGDTPALYELSDTVKKDGLLKDIDESTVGQAEKEFLREAAMRHVVFDYRKIAEYYAIASPEMQSLMEASALVIIDFDSAISNGYVTLDKAIRGDIDA